MDITRELEQIAIACQMFAFETSLKQCPYSVLRFVDSLGVRCAERLHDRVAEVVTVHPHQQVVMVQHETISDNIGAVWGKVFAQAMQEKSQLRSSKNMGPRSHRSSTS